MARYPEAKWLPVTRYDVGGANHIAMSKARRLVLHTAVSDSDSLFGLFNTPGNPVAHFYVREDGTLEQYVDTDIRSSAVLEGNYDSITVESWDGGPGKFHGTDGPPWTEAQLDALAALAKWCSEKHGIPLRQLPSSLSGTSGVGWHRQGIDGNFPPGILAGRVPNGEHWSPSAGKSCPGDTRIRQVVDEVIPRAKGDEMSAQDIKDLKAAQVTQADRIIAVVRATAQADKDRDAAIIAAIDGIPDDKFSKAKVREALAAVLAKQEETI
jgi:hypothetical protein